VKFFVPLGFGIAHAHYVRGDTSAVGLKPMEYSAPLEAVEWISVDKQRRRSVTALYIGDTAERQIGESVRRVKSPGIDCFCACRFCEGEASRQKRRTRCHERTVQKISSFHLLFSDAG
jgi:hypothetical protein